MSVIKATVSGRVQGVGFRWFVVEAAKELNLKGTVKNCLTGREVEIFATGDETVLKQFVKKLEKGPNMARVDQVKVLWLEDDQEFFGFEVIY